MYVFADLKEMEKITKLYFQHIGLYNVYDMRVLVFIKIYYICRTISNEHIGHTLKDRLQVYKGKINMGRK